MRLATSLLFGALAVTGCGARSTLAEGQGDAGVPGTGGHPGATSATATSTSTSTSSNTSASSGTGGAPGCSTDAECGCELSCCGGRCVNPRNDLFNCGSCGNTCTGDPPFCDEGSCGAPPCGLGAPCEVGSFCCGGMCCATGQLCCWEHEPFGDDLSCIDSMKAHGNCIAGNPCTQCAAPDTPIATPFGDRAIASLRVGDLVYSVQGEAVVAVPVRAASRSPARNHRVREVVLASGIVLHISPLHPTADGRTFGDLRPGDRLDEVSITAATTVPYDEPYTYDILAWSDSGGYFAGGALIGSTLHP
jgi:hypothetical protein